MAKKVIKAAEADKKVEALTEEKKIRSAKEVRSKLYGADK